VLAARPTEKSVVVKTSIRDALAMKPYVIALMISFVTAWVLFGMMSFSIATIHGRRHEIICRIYWNWIYVFPL